MTTPTPPAQPSENDLTFGTVDAAPVATLAVPVNPVREPEVFTLDLNGTPDRALTVLVHDSGNGAQRIETWDPELTAAAPRRYKAAPVFAQVESWLRYLDVYKTPDTIAYAHADGTPVSQLTVTAQIDQPAPGRTSWNDHKAHLVLLTSTAWRAWSGIAGQWVSQEQLADHLDARLLDVQNPTAGELWELVANLQATSSFTVSNALRQSGGGTFTYTEDNKLSVEIPPTIALRLPVFEGQPAEDLGCRLRFRIKEKHVQFLVQLVQPEDTVTAAVQRVVATCSSTVPTLSGRPS